MADDLSAVGRFLYEAGTLKQTRRTGWWMAGVRDPESVAERSWRTALIATIIAKLEGADPALRLSRRLARHPGDPGRGREPPREKVNACR